MPRPNPERTIGVERSLRRRITYERERRGWSTGQLAIQMQHHGCPIQQSAIWKVENKGRTVSVDELAALARAFGIDLPDLLRPVEAVKGDEVRTVFERLTLLRRVIDDATAEFDDVFQRATELIQDHDAIEAAQAWAEANPTPLVEVYENGIGLNSGEAGGIPESVRQWIYEED